jgi:hypothetical protein
MSREIDPDQGIFEGTQQPGIQVNLASRNAFGRVPFVEYFNIDPAIFNEITKNDEKAVDPEILEPLLYKATANHVIKRPYPHGGWVVVSPDEYAIIPSSAGAFAERVSARSSASREGLVKDLDTRTASAKRAGAHALQETVLPNLRNLASSYTSQIEELRWLKNEIPKHYLAHAKESKMRFVAHTALESFIDTIETIGAAHNWSGDRVETSKLAVQKRLLAGRGKGTLEPKKAYWSNMIDVSGNHTIAKKGAVVARVYESYNIIDRYLR